MSSRLADLQALDSKEILAFSQLVTRPMKVCVGQTVYSSRFQRRFEGLDERGVERKHLEEVKELIVDGEEIFNKEPMTVVKIEGDDNLYRYDGNHRFVALEELYGPDYEVMVEYVELSEKQAVDASWGVNGGRGKNLTTAEKDRMAREMLRQYPHLTDGALAKLCGYHIVSKTFSNKRKAMTQTEGITFPSIRFDLKNRRIDVSNIGGTASEDEGEPAGEKDVVDFPTTEAPAPTVIDTVVTPAPVKPAPNYVSANGDEAPAREVVKPATPSYVNGDGPVAPAPAPKAQPKGMVQPEPTTTAEVTELNWTIGNVNFSYDGEMVFVSQKGSAHLVECTIDDLRSFIRKFENAAKK